MNVINWLNSPVAEALGWTLLHALWQGFVVVLPVALILHLTRRSRASLRYHVGLGGLLAQVLASVVTFVLYYDPLSAHALPVTSSLNLSLPASFAQAGNESWLVATQVFLAAHLPQVVGLWLAGVLVFGLRLLGGWAYIHRLRSTATLTVPALLSQTATHVADRLNVSVRLRMSARVMGPVVVGIWKPVVLWPVGLLAGLSVADVEAILAHELAHVRRHDYLINVLQSVVEVGFFFHPALWWLSARVREEREHCCDDVALRIVGDARVLARALARVEEWQRSSTEAPALAMAFASKRQLLLQRVRRMLGVPTRPLVSNGHLAGLTLGTLLLLSASVYAVHRTEAPTITRYDLGRGQGFGVTGRCDLEYIDWRGKRLPAAQVQRLQNELAQLISGDYSLRDLPENDRAILRMIIDARYIQIAEKRAELKKALDSLMHTETNRRHLISKSSEYGMTNEGQITYVIWKGQKLSVDRVARLQEQLARVMNGQLNADAVKQPDRDILLTIFEKNAAFDAGMRALSEGMAQINYTNISRATNTQNTSGSSGNSIQMDREWRNAEDYIKSTGGNQQTALTRDTTRMRAAQKQLEALTKQMQAIMAERQPMIDRLSKEMTELSLKISTWQKQNGLPAKQQAALAHQQAALAKQQAQLANQQAMLAQKLAPVDRELERLEGQQSAEAKKLRQRQEQLKKQYEAQMDRLGEQMGKLGSQMGGLGTQMQPMDDKLQPLYQRLGVLADSVSKLSEPTYELSEKIGELSSQIAEDANEQAEKAMQMAEEAMRSLDTDEDTPTPPGRPARPAKPSRPPKAIAPISPVSPGTPVTPPAPAAAPKPARALKPTPAAPAIKGRAVKPVPAPKPAND